MAATGGLSRRRVPQQSQSSHRDDDDAWGLNGNGSGLGGGGGSSSTGNSSLNHSSTPSSSSLYASPSAAATHAGSAFEGGRKIAFDPRDLEREDEDSRQGGKAPLLTIMEEVLLLGLKDKQGYLSFWNDNISYALRGCILIELALRRRIALVKDPNRRQLPLCERIVEVIDERGTGETLLDEALKMIKGQEANGGEKMGVNTWIDLLSGETWNVMKIGFQLKQVRERLAKGLVDKGILRTEKRNFLLFDMATHPVADMRTKESIITRVVSLLTSNTSAVPAQALGKEGTQARAMRAVCLACSAYAASVLDNAFGRLTYEEREAAFQRSDDILAEFANWPFGSGSSSSTSSSSPRKRENRIGMGSSGYSGREAVLGLVQEVKKEMNGEEDLSFELVAGVLEVLAKLDSLL